MPLPNLADREVLRRLADLPRYGQAEAVVRLCDPLWKVALPAIFNVTLERYVRTTHEKCPHCGSDDGEWSDFVSTSAEIEACSEEEADRIARLENPGWTVLRVEPPKHPKDLVPAEFLN